MATVLPGFDRFQGVRGFLDNFVTGILQNQQNQGLSQQLGQVFGDPNKFQGITDPRALQLGGQLAQGEIQNQQKIELAQRSRAPESQTQLTARLAQKLVDGTATQQEEQIFNRLLPPVNTEKELIARASGIRKELDANQEFQNFAVVERQVGIIREAFDEAVNAKGASRIASDQALVIAFNKLLDPTSVVRESEFARTPLQASLINRIRATPAQILQGGITITDDDRKAILDMAERAAAVTGERFNLVHDRFTKIANLSGVRPELVFGGLKKFQSSFTKSTPAQPSGEVEIKSLVRQSLTPKPVKNQIQVRTTADEARIKELQKKAGGQ